MNKVVSTRIGGLSPFTILRIKMGRLEKLNHTINKKEINNKKLSKTKSMKTNLLVKGVISTFDSIIDTKINSYIHK